MDATTPTTEQTGPVLEFVSACGLSLSVSVSGEPPREHLAREAGRALAAAVAKECLERHGARSESAGAGKRVATNGTKNTKERRVRV